MFILPLFTIIFCFSVINVRSGHNEFSLESLIYQLQNNTQWDSYAGLFTSGDMAGFFTPDNINTIFQTYSEMYPNLIIANRSIGKTYQERDMHIYGITNKNSSTDIENKDMILFTGLHHAREPLSISMVIYIFTRIIFDYRKDDIDIRNILDHTVIWFLPYVNIDGYYKIVNDYMNTRSFSYIRKNRNPTAKQCLDDQIGVDLNRNYDFSFAYDNIGSSSKPCDEDYRGPYPFSEPETQAIRDFITKYSKNLRLLMNFHAYGNLWIIPFNYMKDPDSLKANKTIMQIYKDFDTYGNLSSTAVFGNAYSTINYLANGEASDWALGKFGILSFSPELGDGHKLSDSFFPPKSEFVDVLTISYQPIDWILRQMEPNFSLDYGLLYNESQINDIASIVKVSNIHEVYTFQIFNEALSDANNMIIELSLRKNDHPEKLKFLNESTLDNDLQIAVLMTQYDLDDYEIFLNKKIVGFELNSNYKLLDFAQNYKYDLLKLSQMNYPSNKEINIKTIDPITFKRRNYIKFNILFSSNQNANHQIYNLNIQLSSPISSLSNESLKTEHFKHATSIVFNWEDKGATYLKVDILPWILAIILIIIILSFIIFYKFRIKAKQEQQPVKGTFVALENISNGENQES